MVESAVGHTWIPCWEVMLLGLVQAGSVVTLLHKVALAAVSERPRRLPTEGRLVRGVPHRPETVCHLWSHVHCKPPRTVNRLLHRYLSTLRSPVFVLTCGTGSFPRAPSKALCGGCEQGLGPLSTPPLSQPPPRPQGRTEWCYCSLRSLLSSPSRQSLARVSFPTPLPGPGRGTLEQQILCSPSNSKDRMTASAVRATAGFATQHVLPSRPQLLVRLSHA